MQTPDAGISSEDLWVTIVTILFALSLISERIANLIKLNPRISRWNLRDKRLERSDEKAREGQILTLALICGWIVAIISGADLFTLIKEGRLLDRSEYLKEDYRPILGMFLSGFFISLGSKFWHDMLDIVLQFSQLKKYRAEKQEIDNKAGVAVNEDKKLLNLLMRVYPRMVKMNGFMSARFLGSTLELVFVDDPDTKDKDFLDTVLRDVGYTIHIAPELHIQ
jgi:hypothetical protein